MYAKNMPLQVLGVPLVPPQCGIWARRHHAEMTFMNELWVAVVPPPFAATSFFMLLPKASTNFSGAERLPRSSRSFALRQPPPDEGRVVPADEGFEAPLDVPHLPVMVSAAR